MSRFRLKGLKMLKSDKLAGGGVEMQLKLQRISFPNIQRTPTNYKEKTNISTRVKEHEF